MNAFNKGYALIIGIANYTALNSLSTVVVQDAQDVSALLCNSVHGGYLPDHVHTLIDAEATAQSIRLELQWLAQNATPEDTAILFFSGHGGRLLKGALTGHYLLPVDADLQDLKATTIESGELIAFLDQIKAKRLLLLLDCCHASGVGGAKETTDILIPDFKAGFAENTYDRLATGEGRVIIASSKEDEKSWILPGLQNSLFTHYLLKALQGEAKTYGDGFVGVLDVFNYVSEAVPAHAQRTQRQQQPLLKATAANNFPIVLRQAGKQAENQWRNATGKQEDPTLSTTQKLTVQNPNNILLPAEAEHIFPVLFTKRERIIVETEFGKGFSGGRVLLIHPIRQGGTRELPLVVKLGAISLIEKEWLAYQQWIRARLPKSIGIQDQPVLPPNMTWGALRYAMAGDGEFPIASLRTYCQQQKVEDVQFVFEEQLLPTLETLHRQHRVASAFSISDSLDPVLPLNLLIEPATVPLDSEPFELTPATYQHAALKAGDYVRLEGFIIVKVDLKDDTVTLNLPRASSTLPPASFTVRLSSVGDLKSHGVNQVIPPTTGCVKTTRTEQLQAEAKRAIGPRFRPDDDTIALLDGRKFPNPIKELSVILRQLPDVKVSTIHGDVNLENILVHLDTRNISLIDFSEAREDYILHDYFRLETEIVVKLIATSLAAANLGASVVCDFYQQLHKVIVDGEDPAAVQVPPSLEKPFAILVALRKAAHDYLLKREQWVEYYQGMVLYLLSALKFRSLDEEESTPLPKQVAVWGAAALMALAKPQPHIDGTKINDQSPLVDWKFNWEKVRTRLSQDTRMQAKFVDTMLQCPSMSNRSDRDTLVDKLPTDLKVRIRRSDVARVDLVNVVSTMLVYAIGVKNLIEKLQEFEGNNSLPLQDVNKFLRSL